MEKNIEKFNRLKIKFNSKKKDNYFKATKAGYVEVFFKGKEIDHFWLASNATKDNVQVIDAGSNVILAIKDNRYSSAYDVNLRSPGSHSSEEISPYSYNFVVYDKTTGEEKENKRFYQTKVGKNKLNNAISGYVNENINDNQAQL